MPGTMNMPPAGGGALTPMLPYAPMPHAHMQGTPEQHFANHLQDHYGMQVTLGSE